MNNPLVSIHIISYNQEEYIEQTLLSALEQDYENLEVVVADDGSTDGTAKKILEIAKRFPGRLVPVLGEVNVGITKNSNRGLEVCRGKYIAFQGGDDLLLPGKITRQVEWLEASANRVLCGHDVAWVDQNGRPLGTTSSQFRALSSGKGAGQVMRHGPPFSATAVMVRHDRIPPSGFDERMPIVSDWKLWLDVLCVDGEFGFVAGVWAQYRRHSGNVTASHSRPILKDMFKTTMLAVFESRGRLFTDALYWYLAAVRKAIFRKRSPLSTVNSEH